MAARRTYSEDQKAEALAALAANGGNLGRTSRQLDVPRNTLRSWSEEQASVQVSIDRHQKKESLADRLEAVAHKILDLVPDKLQESNLQQLMTSAAIAIDKMQLLRGEPTAIQEQRQTDLRCLTDEELYLLEQLTIKALAAAKPAADPGRALPAPPG